MLQYLPRLTLSALALLSSTQAFVVVPSSSTSSTTLSSTVSKTVSTSSSTSTSTPKSTNPMFEHLKFDNNPTFDVLAKTIEYNNQVERDNEVDESVYAKDYVLRGPVVGPITRKDLGTTKGLGLKGAYPNIQVESFGHTIDPENKYRCFYFQRWRAVQTGDLNAFGEVYPASNQLAEMPVSVFSVVWNPEGKIVYEQVGAVVDRLEGNTQGKAAVFGLLHNAGLKIPANPGDKVFQLLQRLGHFMGNQGRSYSREEDIPKWFTSPSRGADNTEQY